MTSHARLYAAVKILRGTRLLEVRNTSGEPAWSIELQLQAEGRDVSHLVDPMPARLGAHGEVALVLSSAPGPRDVDVVLSWVDSAGVPGNWLGSVRRY